MADRAICNLAALPKLVAEASKFELVVETDSCDCGGERGCEHGTFPYAMRAHPLPDGWKSHDHVLTFEQATMADAELLAALWNARHKIVAAITPALACELGAEFVAAVDTIRRLAEPKGLDGRDGMAKLGAFEIACDRFDALRPHVHGTPPCVPPASSAAPGGTET